MHFRASCQRGHLNILLSACHLIWKCCSSSSLQLASSTYHFYSSISLVIASHLVWNPSILIISFFLVLDSCSLVLAWSKFTIWCGHFSSYASLLSSWLVLFMHKFGLSILTLKWSSFIILTCGLLSCLALDLCTLVSINWGVVSSVVVACILSALGSVPDCLANTVQPAFLILPSTQPVHYCD